MSLPPRQPRPVLAGGSPRLHDIPHEQRTPDERMQVMLDAVRHARIPKPGGWSNLPWVGPAWEAAYDLQEGDYAGAAFNAAMVAAELSPVGPARRAVKLVNAVNDMRRGAFLARAGTQAARIRKIEKVGKGFELHHTEPLAGLSRKAEGLAQNHPANFKIMKKADHRRLTGNWTDPQTGQLLPRFGPAQQVWHGTNALQKSDMAARTAVGADAVQNLLSWDAERRKR